MTDTIDGTAGNPTVTTTEGPVRGERLGGVAVFRGIPYAQPPVGPLRFQRPARPEPRAQEFAATHFGPPAPQFALGAVESVLSQQQSFSGAHGQGSRIHDWLTLNVWVPAGELPARDIQHSTAEPRPAGLPIMVWIHGGAFVEGAGSDPEYDGTVFAESGVVCVSINYRMGIEGFMHFPDAPDNRGLLDQIAALEWVRDNARAFGGDPERITVFGESAGAGSIQCLLSMPQSRGLFRRAILQSPPAMLLSTELAAQVTQLFARIGTSALESDAASAARTPAQDDGSSAAAGSTRSLEPTAASFAALTPEECQGLMAAYAGYRAEHSRELFANWGKAAAFIPPLVPVVDGEVLTASPWESHAAAAFPDIDLLVGQTRDEFALFNHYAGDTEVSAQTAQSRLLLVGPGSHAREDGLAGAGPTLADIEYRHALGESTAQEVFERCQSDYMFTVPTLLAATSHVEAGGSAYVYVVAVDPAGGIGSPHVVDLPVLFDQFGFDHGKLFYPQAGEDDRRLGERMRAAWVAFARDGEPGWERWLAPRPDSVQDGAAAQKAGGTTAKIFGYEDRVAPHPFWERFMAFREAPSRALKLTDNAE